MSKILIPMAMTKLGSDTITPIHFVRETYIKKILRYGGEPIFISALSPREMIDTYYEKSDGLLCVGGSDFDPSYYGEGRHQKTHPEEPLRDELELYLIKKALNDRKPYLGICRGCQGLAIAAGGSLYQHVPDIAQNEKHGISEGGSYDTLRTQKGHSLLIEKGTTCANLIGVSEIVVNSGHHQSVCNPGIDMVIAGRSPGGIVEIIEHKDISYFCIGVQSHPEAIDEGPLEPVLKAFFMAVKNGNASRLK